MQKSNLEKEKSMNVTIYMYQFDGSIYWANSKIFCPWVNLTNCHCTFNFLCMPFRVGDFDTSVDAETATIVVCLVAWPIRLYCVTVCSWRTCIIHSRLNNGVGHCSLRHAPQAQPTSWKRWRGAVAWEGMGRTQVGWAENSGSWVILILFGRAGGLVGSRAQGPIT